ncbi:HemK/PrmC family methyltransferase [uncultured Actinomyces sp.]|uniref:N5-glutamine methyltransferase family protein n=1 Tax=uncultured Actinomyces sp. TaxID=249061 RepID=UPI0028D1F4CC|nr:HemK/PrmC family methyltransferase [uncultured Actinomyces sp.]
MSSQAELIAWGSSLLNALEGDEGGATPLAEARYLLTWALGVDSLLFAPREVPPANEATYRAAVAKRALRHPRSHVTGEMYFRGLVLSGGKGVFTVRPETEMLVEHVEALARSGVLPDGEWVDLCTGSAAIALALATETGHQVTAVEIESDAFAYAKRNLARYPKAQIRLVKGDATATDTLRELNGKTSLVVTNPPYVPAQEAPTQIEAQQDPARALYGGGDDGTEIPRRIIERSRELLVSGGMLAMEHSPSQAQTLREVAVMNGFTQVHTRSDLSGVERFLIAWKTQRK